MTVQLSFFRLAKRPDVARGFSEFFRCIHIRPVASATIGKR
jgi:hypothetical protein